MISPISFPFYFSPKLHQVLPFNISDTNSFPPSHARATDVARNPFLHGITFFHTLYHSHTLPDYDYAIFPLSIGDNAGFDTCTKLCILYSRTSLLRYTIDVFWLYFVSNYSTQLHLLHSFHGDLFRFLREIPSRNCPTQSRTKPLMSTFLLILTLLTVSPQSEIAPQDFSEVRFRCHHMNRREYDILLYNTKGNYPSFNFFPSGSESPVPKREDCAKTMIETILPTSGKRTPFFYCSNTKHVSDY